MLLSSFFFLPFFFFFFVYFFGLFFLFIFLVYFFGLFFVTPSHAVFFVQNQCFPIEYGESFYQGLLDCDSDIVCILAISSETGLLAGFGTARIESSVSICRTSTHSGYISTLGVASDFRGIGLGGNLLRVCLLCCS
jgi:ribosomal protein S18 acetylase RimI-like enzyme